MIPSVLGRQVRHAVEEYITTQYVINTPRFENTVRDFVRRGEMFKGPYVSFHLPFKEGDADVDYFPQLNLSFKPYLHQQQAFARLTQADPKPTIVATGTGSGKTEAFLYPILDYCLQQANQRGVKAILIYPMNALATDQAKRIAGIIHDTPSLRGRVTAGLYVGGQASKPNKVMTEDSVITDRWTMQREPPDILLTNYKMLDYLLIQPGRQEIWQHNQPDRLRFIVVDELHTFDGAQGTDLACLLRRLKHRLKSPSVCPIGTSATLGIEDSEALLQFAEDIFAERFDKKSIITESRLNALEFNGRALWALMEYPSGPEELNRLDPDQYTTLHEYIAAQYEVWTGKEADAEAVQQEGWALELGGALLKHAAFKNLVLIVESGTKTLTDIASQFKQSLGPEAEEHAERIVESLLALVSYARDPDKPARPLLNLRVQFWIRELRRMGVSMDTHARLRWFDDLQAPADDAVDEGAHHLPLTVCRNCGAAAWVAIQWSANDPLEDSASQIYEAFFHRNRELTLVFPDDNPTRPAAKQLCLGCLRTVSQSTKDCSECATDNMIGVCVPSLTHHKPGRTTAELKCPYCAHEDSFSIFGAQSASLSSVGIGQIFGSRYNDDKKVITFSNSVQDASHRAGFFQARTYQFALRTSLIQHIAQEGDGQSLSDLQTSFVHSLQQKHDDAGFVGEFIAPNMTWLQAYKDLVEDKKTVSLVSLIDDIERRLHYEVLLIFGLQARLGRNLENIRSVTAAPDRQKITQAASQVLHWLRNELGGLESLGLEDVCRFIAGLMYRLRVSGGIADPIYKEYIESDGSSYKLGEQFRDYLPRMHPRSARPAFVCDRESKAFLHIGSASRKTWIAEWATKCLFKEQAIHAHSHETVRPILDALVEEGLLEQYKASGNKRAWGIPPKSLLITTDLASARCTTCSYEVCFPVQDTATWSNMPCPRFECTGNLTPADVEPEDYYRARYRSNDSVRVVAEEHTGLLERDEREAVEKAFTQKDRRPWHPNVLSCTPTLELGVDIGDLSTVMQTAVPPQKSNYVQRIGRAGRRDGNALALTVATASPHDLYYFADPMLMMAGAVDVPGIFLNAPSVLKRQLIAFTLDSWVAGGISKKAVDKRVQNILGRVAKGESGNFPYNWLEFAEENAESLLESFESMFGASIQKDATIMEQMAGYLGSREGGTGSTLRSEVEQAFSDAYHEREELKRQRNGLTKQIKKLDQAVRDANYREDRLNLVRQRAAIFGLIAIINRKNVFNFLTDAGLLPNYAFPQSGVSLKSVILFGDKQQEKADGPSEKTKIESKSEEYVRPGMMAIRELAPGSTFYSGKRKIRVKQIDVKKSPIEDWRLCSSCSYGQMAATATSDTCPRCNARDWTDVGRVFKMARMSTVTSISGDRSSRSLDETEERVRTFHQVRTLVQFEEKDADQAHACSKAAIPFGFQFIRKATVRLINCGRRNPEKEPYWLAGQEQFTHGFSSCPECGNVHLPGRSFRHEYACVKQGASPKENKNVLLYHDFESEAMRVLLPALTGSQESTKVDSFCAALHLGLKTFMGGQLDHLLMHAQDDPVDEATDLRKNFVFVIDTVPGGTGYLKFLLEDPQNILNVLRTALEKLKACSCQHDEDLDGCYQCLFAYRNTYRRDRISRRAAMEVIELILNDGGELTKTESLDRLPFNRLLESMCEVAFVNRLDKYASRTAGWSFNPIQIRGHQGYELNAAGYKWAVECQVDLKLDQNVVVACRPDFVLWPQDAEKVRPIAVFADGFAYHHDRLADDTNKRMAILASRNFYVWSLTWNDLHSSGGYFEDFLKHNPTRLNETLHEFGLTKSNFAHLKDKRASNSMTMLLAHLQNPEPSKWRALAFAYTIAMVNARRDNGWVDDIKQYAPDWFRDCVSPEQDDAIGMSWTPAEDVDRPGLAWVRISRNGTTRRDISSMQAGVYIDDSQYHGASFKPVWNGFLNAMNLLQFLPNSGFFCKTGLMQEEYDLVGSVWGVERHSVE